MSEQLEMIKEIVFNDNQTNADKIADLAEYLRLIGVAE